MYFFGDFLADEQSVAFTPTDVDGITKATLTGAWFDYFKVTHDVDSSMSQNSPTEWDNNTVLLAEFDGTTNAGNLDWSVDNTNAILLKRRKKNTNGENWITIFAHEITTEEDFKFTYIDFLNQANVEYEYALVPIFENSEGEYTLASVWSEMDEKIFLMEKDNFWNAIVTDAALNSTRNISKSYHTVLHRRYPTTTTSATVNYDSGTSDAQWYPFDEDNCELIFDDPVRYPYQKRFMDYLTNYNPKILKAFDGRIWLVDVDPSPSDTMNEVYFLRTVSFGWTEIGHYESENDLYRANLIDVEPKYWSSNDTGLI